MTELIKVASMRSSLSPELGYIDIRVDRASVLGNPFELTNEEDRDKVCDAYNEWLHLNLLYSQEEETKYVDLNSWVELGFKIATKFKKPSCQQVGKEINRHVELLLQGKSLRYQCWCKRKDRVVRCHADSIKKQVLAEYKREVNAKN